MKDARLSLKRILASLRLKTSLFLLFCAIALFVVLPSGVHAAWNIDAVDAPKYFTNMSQRSIAIDKITNQSHVVYGGDHLYHAWYDGVQLQYEKVDNSAGVGEYASIAIDSSNKIHISYYDSANSDLKYANNASGSWVTFTIDSTGDVGQYTSIAVDLNNKIYISYYDQTNGDLKYATNVSGSWVTSTLDSTGYVGQYTSIAVDSNNKVHISYYDGYLNYDLKYATNASGTWVTSTIDSTGDVGRYTSLSVDANNKVHISYSDWTNYDLKYATNASGSWTASTIDSTQYGYTSIAVDGNNKVHISYGSGLNYATNVSGSWVISTINATGNVGQYTSIAVDSNNKVYISYYDQYQSNSDLKYATNAFGPWVTSAIDSSSDVGKYSTSIAVDSNNRLHISYYDTANNELKYTTNASGSWVTSVISAIDGSGYDGRYTSIAVDSNNKVHISYYYYYLKYATNASGSWVTSTIDSTGGFYTSLAVDSNNKIHISYRSYNGTNDTLKYATNASGAWVTFTLDSTGVVGLYTSIILDTGDNVHISYFDQTNGDLKYATNASGSWVISTIDSIGYVGRFTSIDVDSNNKVHISYDSGGLKYATNVSGSWVTSTIDSTGPYTSIAVDSNNKIHISYHHNTNYDLKYATNASGSWVTSTLDSTGVVGLYTSITLDTGNNVHISYYDISNRDLKYATNSNVTGLISVNSGSNYTNSVSATLNVFCEAIGGGDCVEMQFSNDNSNWSIAEAYAVSKSWDLAPGDGVKTVYVKFKDLLNNWSSAYRDTIILDTTIPAGILSINSGAPFSTSPATLTLTCLDANGCAEMQFSNDNISWSPPEAFNVTKIWDLTTGDIEKTVYAKVNDFAGNWSDVFFDTVVQETVLPIGSVLLNSGETYTTLDTVTLELACDDGSGSGCSEMMFSNDDITYSFPVSFASTASWTLSSGDGPKTVYVKFRDAAGNWSASYSDTITLDTAEPVGAIAINGGSASANSRAVTLNLTCTDTSACAEMQFSNDLANWSALQPYSDTAAWMLAAGDGNKTVYVKITDMTAHSSIFSDTITLEGSPGEGWTIETADAPRQFSGYYERAIAVDSGNNPHLAYGYDHLYHSWFDGHQWRVETVDRSPYVGQYASIAIDQDDKVHISYYDSGNTGIKYATNASGSWMTVSLDLGEYVGYETSIAVDSGGKIHIISCDDWNGGLKYTTNASGSWVTVTVDSNGYVGRYSSIAVDANDSVHIAYVDDNHYSGGVKYATNKTGQWQISVVDPGYRNGYYPSIAVDSNSKVHISYYDSTNYNLKYATNSFGLWVVTTLDLVADGNGRAGEYNSLALDSEGRVHISYMYSDNYNEMYCVNYFTNASGEWTKSSIDCSGERYYDYTSIAVDSNNKVHIGYGGDNPREVKYAANISGAWVSQAIDVEGRVGQYTAIDTDSNNKAHIIYQDLINSSLKYASDVSGLWENSVFSGTYGYYHSIAIDSDDKIHVSYYDGVNQDLKYDTNASGSWIASTIDSTGNVGQYNSIAVDSNNKIHISYYDQTNGDLKYATNASGSWVISTIDSAGYVGEYASIAVDLDNKVHISYMLGYLDASTNYDLKYATNASGSWVTSTIDLPGNVGEYTSIAIDSNNKVHVSYYDSTNQDLKYASDESGPWEASKVDAGGDVGKFNSIGVDSNQKVHISYYDQTNGDLKYTTNVSGVWVTSTLDSEGWGVGQYTSLAVDSNNDIHISYDDPVNTDLKYATTADSTPPVTTETPTAGIYPNSQSVSLSCYDERAGCQDTYYCTGPDCDPITPYTGPIAVSESTDLRFYSMDNVGNKEDVKTASFIIDTISPTGTITINSGADYTKDVNITLTISVADISGVTEMKFSADGTNWTSPEAYQTTKSITISEGDGIKMVYSKFKDGMGNWSDAVSDWIILDTTPPSGTVTYPANNAVLNEVDSITGSASDALSGISKVELQITDGTNYVTEQQWFTTTPTWVTANGLGAWAFNTIFVNWKTEATYTVYVKVTDAVGNSSTSSSTFMLYSGSPAYTTLSIELSAPRILSGGTVDIVGQLLRLPENGVSRNGLTIKFEITGPSPTPPATQTTTYTDSGLYSKSISGFITEGIYTIKAVFDGNELLLPDESPEMSVYVGPSAGYAIIVEGKIPGGQGLSSHNKTTNRIYTKLRARGFNEDDIYYFNYNTGQAGVDEMPTKQGIEYAVKLWAKWKMNYIAAPLFIIMTNHGNSTDGIYLDNESITPADLNNWLNALEGGLNAAAQQKKRIVITGACYSGSFIPVVSKTGRVVISSSAANEVSHKGPYENESGQEIRSGEFFLEELFTSLERGASIREAFEEATENTEVFTRRDNAGWTDAPYFDNAVQHPLLDDNGDGIGSNVLSSSGDGNVAKDLYFGAGNYYVPNSAANPAEVTKVTETVYLTSVPSDNSHTMWVNVNDDLKVDGGRIWFEVRPPSKTLSGTGGSDQAVANYVYNFLLKTGPNHWEKRYGNCTDPCNKFDEYGKYEIFYFVRDSATQKVSPMRRSVVYKDKPGNNPTNAFNLTSPAHGSEQMTTLLLLWEDAVDPDGDALTYTVMISKDNTFATVDYIKEEITHNATVIGSEAGMSDLKTYYWKVLAIDPYGKKTESNQVWSFHTNDTNPNPPGYIVGWITNSATGAGIGGAIAKRDGVSDQDDARSDGYYLFSTASGNNISITASKTGYASVTKTVNLAAGGSSQLNFALTPTTPLTANFSGSPTSGTEPLTVNFTDISTGGVTPLSCQWDLDNNGSTDSTVQNPSAIYNAGTYSVKLTVTDANSSSNTLTRTNYISVCYSNANIVGSTNTYSTLQSAYDAAVTGSTIQARDVTITETINFNRPITVAIQGGYNCDHTTNIGKTIINGTMTISDGMVTLENAQVQ